MTSLIEDCCKNNATEQGIPIGKHYFERLMVAIMTWLSVTKYLCHMWQLICSVYCGQIPPSLRLWFITRFVHMCNTAGAAIEADNPHLFRAP